MLSNFLLFNIMYVRCLITIQCRCFIIVLISLSRILSFSKFLIGCLWIAPLTPTVMMMRGLTCQPAILSVWMSALYFAVFSLCAVFGNMSWQYVNSMNYMTFDEVDVRGGGWLSMGAPSTHSIFGLSLAKNMHGVVGHVHWSSHCGTVLSCGLEFWLPTFIRV